MDPWTFRRISVRVLEQGAARDVVGRVVNRTADEVRLMRRDGTLESLRIADLVAAREVPDDPGRRRPAETFDRTKLHQIVAAHDPLFSGDEQILVKDLTGTDLPVPRWGNTPDADWWSLAPESWQGVADQFTVSEFRAFGRIPDQAICRVVLAGDWCGLNIASVQGADNRAAIQLASEAFAWAEPVGAFMAWAVVHPASQPAELLAEGLGFGRSA